MPAWNEILNETKAAGSAQDIIRRRRLRRLSRYTRRNVILYYSGWLQKPHLLRSTAAPAQLGRGLVLAVKGLAGQENSN